MKLLNWVRNLIYVLGRRAICAATHRDAASGGVVRVYHVHNKGWTKIIEGQDVNKLHYEFMEEKGKELRNI